MTEDNLRERKGSGLKDLGTFCNKVHRFILNLHSLKIMIVESVP